MLFKLLQGLVMAMEGPVATYVMNKSFNQSPATIKSVVPQPSQVPS